MSKRSNKFKMKIKRRGLIGSYPRAKWLRNSLEHRLKPILHFRGLNILRSLRSCPGCVLRRCRNHLIYYAFRFSVLWERLLLMFVGGRLSVLIIARPSKERRSLGRFLHNTSALARRERSWRRVERSQRTTFRCTSRPGCVCSGSLAGVGSRWCQESRKEVTGVAGLGRCLVSGRVFSCTAPATPCGCCGQGEVARR